MPTWNRETISKLPADEKYVGDVVLGKANVIDGVQVKSQYYEERIKANPRWQFAGIYSDVGNGRMNVSCSHYTPFYLLV